MENTYGSSEKRTTALVVTGIASFFFAILWLNNLVVACQYHVALFRGVGQASVSAAKGIFPFLAWSSADVSTVSTLIPFFGCLLMFVGLFQVKNSEDWPFFPGYDRFNVALGLLGTLWGIILIGYYPAQDISVAALMSCLHTAMYSTLISVLWVMVIKPVALIPWLNRIRREGFDVEADDDAIGATVDSLLKSLSAMNGEMKTLATASGTFSRELAALNKELKACHENESKRNRDIAECLAAMGKLLGEFDAMHKNLMVDREMLMNEKIALQTELKEVNGKLDGAMNDKLRLTGENGALLNKVESVEAANRALTGEKNALAEELQASKGKLADAFAEKTQLAKEVGGLQQSLAGAEADKQSLSNELERANADKKELTVRNAALEQDFDKLTRQLTAIREALK